MGAQVGRNDYVIFLSHSPAILGKALYTGRLDLKTVIEEVGSC